METTTLRSNGSTGTVDVETPAEVLKQRMRGAVLRQGDDGYDAARRVWNRMIDRRPAIIARCTGATDVIACVNVAREYGLPLSVRGGGHNAAGYAVCDGGLMVDLSLMRGVWVDAAARAVRVQGGATWGDVDRETQLFGMATPGGVISTTGVAGLTLGGGLSWQRRKHGMSIDNLLSVELVTADGRLLRASPDENPELFWGIRGGGGNFGIVTSFEFRLHELGPEVMLVETMYPLDKARDVLRFFRRFVADAPDEVTAEIMIWSVPSVPEIPREMHGTPFIAMEAFYTGPAEEGARVLQPLREITTPLADLSGPRPYVVLQSMYDGFFPAGRYYHYWKSLYLDALPDAVIDAIAEKGAERPSPLALITLRHLGGAISRVRAGATAFGDRSAEFLLSIDTSWDDPNDTDACIAWTRRFWSEARPYSRGKMYINFPGLLEEGESLLRSSYGDNYDRLVALKDAYDPTNLFRLNQNIRPPQLRP